MQKHHWKRLFFLLLGVNLTAILILLILFNIPIEDQQVPQQVEPAEDRVLFEIKTERKDVNKLIEHYIRKEVAEPFTYKVRLEENGVILFGEVPIAGMVIDLKMTFEPMTLKNGDLLLEQKQFSIGRVNLPIPILLKIIQESNPFPEWITFQPNKHRIYISLYNMKLKSDSKLKVKKFDLENDQIEFILEVPVK